LYRTVYEREDEKQGNGRSSKRGGAGSKGWLQRNCVVWDTFRALPHPQPLSLLRRGAFI